MSTAISSFDAPDQATVDAAYRVAAAARAVDLPDHPPLSRQAFEGNLRHPMPGRAVRAALASRGDIPIGYVVLYLPQVDNTDNASVELVVHPAHRRQGIGRALFEHAVRAVGELGRKRLISSSVGPLPDGPPRPAVGAAFATALGAQPALVDVRRRLTVDEVNQADLDALFAAAHRPTAGYRLVCWQGNTSDGYATDVGYLESRLLHDAPLGDLVIEPDRVDAARLRDIERVLALRQRRVYQCGAVHEASGRLVAWTAVHVLPGADDHADQQTTIVDPDHRGHRLGLLVKIENLRQLLAHEPRLRVVDTWNAVDNPYMIAINEQLGFRAVDAWTNWQLHL